MICTLRRFAWHATDGRTRKCVRIDTAHRWIVYAVAVELLDSISGNEDFLELMPVCGPMRLLYGNKITALLLEEAGAETVTLQTAIEKAVADSKNRTLGKKDFQYWTLDREPVRVLKRGRNRVFAPETVQFTTANITSVYNMTQGSRYLKSTSRILGVGRIWYRQTPTLLVVFRAQNQTCVSGGLGELCGEERKLSRSTKKCRMWLTESQLTVNSGMRGNQSQVSWWSPSHSCEAKIMLAVYQQLLERSRARTFLEISARVFLLESEFKNAELTIGKGFLLGISTYGEFWIRDVERAVITGPFFVGVAGYLAVLFCSGIIWIHYRKGIEVSVTEMYKRRSAESSGDWNDDQPPKKWPLVRLVHDPIRGRHQLFVG